MIAFVNARLHVICDGCWRRWPASTESLLDVPLTDGPARHRHLCDACRGEPIA